MSVLKSLRCQLTCVEVPWGPAGPATGRRLIDEIALCGESGELAGGCIGHFELYVRSMQQSGANTEPIESFVACADASIRALTARARLWDGVLAGDFGDGTGVTGLCGTRVA